MHIKKLAVVACFVVLLGAGCNSAGNAVVVTSTRVQSTVPTSTVATTTTEAVATTSVPIAYKACGIDFNCLVAAAKTCQSATGTLFATSHPLDENRDIIPGVTVSHAAQYSIDSLDDPFCDFHYTQTDTSKNSSRAITYSCQANAGNNSMQDFLTSWKKGEFFNDIMAYCNPINRDKDDATMDYPYSDSSAWECGFHAITCTTQQSPF